MKQYASCVQPRCYSEAPVHGVVLMGDDGGTTDFSSGSGGRGMI